MSKETKKTGQTKSKSHLIYMPDIHWEMLASLAEARGVSKSAMIRMLVIKESEKPNE